MRWCVGCGFEIMLDSIVERLVELIFRLLVEIVLFYTGEIVLFLMTLGQRTPRWDYYADESVTKFVLFTDMSVIVGLLFWMVVFFLSY